MWRLVAHSRAIRGPSVKQRQILPNYQGPQKLRQNIERKALREQQQLVKQRILRQSQITFAESITQGRGRVGLGTHGQGRFTNNRFQNILQYQKNKMKLK